MPYSITVNLSAAGDTPDPLLPSNGAFDSAWLQEQLFKDTNKSINLNP